MEPELRIFQIHDKCTGCGACVMACQHDCLDLQSDNEGFLYPQMAHADKCVQCRLCENVCHVLKIDICRDLSGGKNRLFLCFGTRMHAFLRTVLPAVHLLYSQIIYRLWKAWFSLVNIIGKKLVWNLTAPIDINCPCSEGQDILNRIRITFSRK